MNERYENLLTLYDEQELMLDHTYRTKKLCLSGKNTIMTNGWIGKGLLDNVTLLLLYIIIIITIKKKTKS